MPTTWLPCTRVSHGQHHVGKPRGNALLAPARSQCYQRWPKCERVRCCAADHGVAPQLLSDQSPCPSSAPRPAAAPQPPNPATCLVVQQHRGPGLQLRLVHKAHDGHVVLRPHCKSGQERNPSQPDSNCAQITAAARQGGVQDDRSCLTICTSLPQDRSVRKSAKVNQSRGRTSRADDGVIFVDHLFQRAHAEGRAAQVVHLMEGCMGMAASGEARAQQSCPVASHHTQPCAAMQRFNCWINCRTTT